MKFENFRSGEWIQQYQYKSFLPVTVNREWCWEDAQINTLLERASRALAELDAFTLIVPDVDLFIQMHITKEANNSSRIEGTQTHMDEAVLDRNQLAPEKRDDWQEVQNYIQAINEAVDELQRLPLSNRLLKHTHSVLMQGVRGEHKTPGEFRISQNWIGGSSLADATFSLLRKPSLYLSDFFERNRASYYDALMRVRTSNDMIHWIKFFLSAVIETADKGKKTFEAILALRREIDLLVLTYGKRAEKVQLLLLHLYRRPAITAIQASEMLDVSHQTASALLKKMTDDGILQEVTGYQRNRLFVFTRYLDLFTS